MKPFYMITVALFATYAPSWNFTCTCFVVYRGKLCLFGLVYLFNMELCMSSYGCRFILFSSHSLLCCFIAVHQIKNVSLFGDMKSV